MKIYNATPHNISIFNERDVTFNKVTRKHELINDGCSWVHSIPSDSMLNAAIIENDTSTVIDGITFKKSPKIEVLDSLPDGYDLYIVSKMYADACKDKSRLATVGAQVYNDGKIVGCLFLYTY
jgi:hypothetical protein